MSNEIDDIAEQIIPVAITVGVAYFGGATFAAGAFLAGSTFALGFYSTNERKKKEKQLRQGARDIADRKQLISEAVTTRKIIYGQAEVSGPLVAIHTTNNNSDLHYVVPVAGHRCHSFDSIFLNDEYVPLEGDMNTGLVTAIEGHKYHNKFFVRGHLGEDDQTVDETLHAADPVIWPDTRRLRGVAYFYCKFVYDEETYPNGIPRNMSAVVKGKPVVDLRSTSSVPVWSQNPALILRDYLTDPLFGVNFPETDIDRDSFIAGANLCDRLYGLETFTPGNTNTTENVQISGQWITAPDIPINTGDRISIFDINFNALSGIAWTNGAGSFRLSRSTQHAAAGEFISPPPGFDISTFVSFNRTHESTYTVNGSFDTASNHNDIISQLLFHQAADIVYSGKSLRLLNDTVNPDSVDTLEEKDFIGISNVSSKVDRFDRFNVVRGLYVSPLNQWQPTEYPNEESAVAIAEDGERIPTEFILDLCVSQSMAQRLARAYLTASRNEITIEAEMNMKGWKYAVGDALDITLPQYGFNRKKFIITGFGMKPNSSGALVCALSLKEAVASRETITEQGVIKSVISTLPNPFSYISQPTNLVLASGDSQLRRLQDGSIQTYIEATWDNDNDNFVSQYDLEYRESVPSGQTENEWIQESIPRAFKFRQFGPVVETSNYDIRVRARTAVNTTSAWTTINDYVVIGKTAPPPMIGWFRVETARSGTREFHFDTSNFPPDVLSGGGGVLIRFSSDLNATWENMQPVRTRFRSSPWSTEDISPGTYRFGIKMVDNSNNESVNALFQTVTLGAQNLGDVFREVNESETDFNGTITSGVKIQRNSADSKQIISSPDTRTTWSQAPTPWTAQRKWDDSARSDGSVVYSTAVIDLGASRPFFATPNADTSGGTPTISLKYSNTLNSSGELTNFTTVSIVEGTVSRFITARYAQFTITVPPAHSGTTINNAVLRNLIVSFSASSVPYRYNRLTSSVETARANIPGYSRLAAGRIRLEHLGGAAEITDATVNPIGSRATGGFVNYALTNQTQRVGSTPASVVIELYDRQGVLTDGELAVVLFGPESNS